MLRNKFIAVVLGLILSTKAFSYTVVEVCFKDYGNSCALVAYNASFGGLIEYILPSGGFGPHENEIARELNAAGIPTETVFPIQYQRRVAFAKKRVYLSAEDQMGAMARFPDVQFDMIQSIGECVVGVASCAGTAPLVVETFGMAWWIAKFTCGGAGWLCTNAIRNYEKYKAWELLQKEEAERYRREHPTEVPAADLGGNDTGSGIESGGGDGLGGLMDGALPASPVDHCAIRHCSVDIKEETPS